MNGYDIEDMKIGMSASFAKTITEADIILFAGASGDNNEAIAKATSSARRAAKVA
jgi:3-hydroxybutyryl-CoA dehydratase